MTTLAHAPADDGAPKPLHVRAFGPSPAKVYMDASTAVDMVLTAMGADDVPEHLLGEVATRWVRACWARQETHAREIIAGDGTVVAVYAEPAPGLLARMEGRPAPPGWPDPQRVYEESHCSALVALQQIQAHGDVVAAHRGV